MADRSPSRTSPSCPRCQSLKTVLTFDYFGEQLFFCADCEHSWAEKKGTVPTINKPERM
jgi:transposase-like protein